MSQKIFVCSDIHGFYEELKTGLRKKGFNENNPEHILMVLGDVFDRGHEAVKLFNFLTKLQKKNRLMYVIGNHEFLLRKLVNEIMREGITYNSAHYTNGTIGTLAQFANDSEITRKFNYWEILSQSEREKLYEAIKPVLDFTYTAVNYYEIDKYIFVHGWIPFHSKDKIMYHARKQVGPKPDWRNIPSNDHAWEEATWLGYPTAMDCDFYEPNKIIVVGHWDVREYRYKTGEITSMGGYPLVENDFNKFLPVFTDNFIALDACTAVSHIVNVIVFEKTDDEQFVLLDK